MSKVKTVLTSVVVKLGFVAAVLGVLVGELTPYVDVPYVGAVLPYLTGGIVVLGVVSRIVARVAEVPDEIKGLEPVSTADKAFAFANQAEDEIDVQYEQLSADPDFWGPAV